MKKKDTIGDLYDATKIKKFLSKNKPKEAKYEVYFKSYPRFKKINLKSGNMPIVGAILKKRVSERNFSKPISFDDLSKILFYSVGRNSSNQKKERRFYPSAGGLFPIELYVVNQRTGKSLEKGVYHYNIKDNALELINGRVSKIIDAFSESFIKNASYVFLITSITGRSSVKYSTRALRYIFIEAGHIGQNIYLCSNSLGVKCCAIGGFQDDEVIKGLDLDEDLEVPIYALAVGR